MSDSIVIRISIRFIKYFNFVYHLISYSINILLNKQWKLLNQCPDSISEESEILRTNGCWTEIKSKQSYFFAECLNVSEIFSKSVQIYKDKKCLGFRRILSVDEEKQPNGKIFRKVALSDYQWLSYREIDERVNYIASGLLWSGIRPGDNVLVYAETNLEWMLTFQALLRIGITVVIFRPIFTYSGDNEIIHCINETEVTHIITSFDLLTILLRLESRIPLVKCIIFMEKLNSKRLLEIKNSALNLFSFSHIEQKGKWNQNLRGEKAKPDDIAVIIYTSGSTGLPKGVMISHKNLLKVMQSFSPLAQVLSPKDIYIAYLPLAHLYELEFELFFLSLGMSIGYATPSTLTENSTGIKKGYKGDSSLLRPTVMAAVPLILNRIRKNIEEQVEQRGYFFKNLFNLAIDYKKLCTKNGFKTPILNYFICRKLKSILGGNIRIMTVASAPIAPETHEFIRESLDVSLLQGYGLTEASALVSLMDLNDINVGHVGRPLPGVHVKLVDWIEGNYTNEDKPNPRGELVIGGENISVGYYKNESLTKECFKEEDDMRWFYSGDIGEIFADGTIKIIDRKKDLVKLQSGVYISLGKIEAEFKNCPFVDNICVYGNSRHSYLVGLVVPNPESIQALAEKLSKPKQISFSELCRDKDIIQFVLTAIQEFGIKSNLHKNEIPLKIKLCCEEWLPESGLVTAALKIRRKKIQEYYSMDINLMHGIEKAFN